MSGEVMRGTYGLRVPRRCLQYVGRRYSAYGAVLRYVKLPSVWALATLMSNNIQERLVPSLITSLHSRDNEVRRRPHLRALALISTTREGDSRPPPSTTVSIR
jgi:hypothetical protein